jgi:hypothetical protein
MISFRKAIEEVQYGSMERANEGIEESCLSKKRNIESMEIEGRRNEGIEESCQGCRTRNQGRWNGKERESGDCAEFLRKPNIKSIEREGKRNDRIEESF